jgi:hypothetical protein
VPEPRVPPVTWFADRTMTTPLPPPAPPAPLLPYSHPPDALLPVVDPATTSSLPPGRQQSDNKPHHGPRCITLQRLVTASVRRSHLPDAPDTGPQDNVMPPAARDVAAVPVTQDRAPALDADASPVPPFKAPEVEAVPLPVPTTAVPDPAEESPVDSDREPDDPPAATPLPTTTEPDAPPAVVPEDSTRNPVLPLVPPSAV